MSDIAQRLISAAEDFPEIEENPSDLYCAASVEIQHLRARLAAAEAVRKTLLVEAEALVSILEGIREDPEVINAYRCHYDENDIQTARVAIDAARGGE